MSPSTTTVQQIQADTEIWLNTASGMRWYRCLDLYGRETTKTVQGGKTFTLTTFERQLNQDHAASPEQDLFRDGTFVIRKESENTNPEEVRSPNSLTDAEVLGLAMELTHGKDTPENILKDITSSVTMNRIYEAVVTEDAPAKVISAVKERRNALAPNPAPKSTPKSEPVVTKPDEEDEFDRIKGEPVVADVKDEK